MTENVDHGHQSDGSLTPPGGPQQPPGRDFARPIPPVAGWNANQWGPSAQAFPPGAQVVVVSAQKSVGVALLLSFFFGPLGMLYSTVAGALVMLFVNLVVALITFGFGLFLTWPICMIWAAVAASSHNTRLGTARYLPPR